MADQPVPPDPNEEPTLVNPAELPTLTDAAEMPTLVDAAEMPTLGNLVTAPAPAGMAPIVFAAQDKIGGYTLIRKLGEGGMGVVYEALQESPRREVALKIIRGAFVDEQAVRMFQREAQALARLQHPGIAAIYASGSTPDGQHYFAMELVRGLRLDHFLQRARPDVPGRAAVRARLELFLALCDAVSYAHQRGVIHRDLKPANILVREADAGSTSASSGRLASIKVLDFGLARIAEDDLGGPNQATRPGTIQGTVPYMSPEQVQGHTDRVDVRSDVYALGVILYEMLAGQLPYDLSQMSLLEAARVICEQPPRSLRQAAGAALPISHDLEVIVRKALEKDPAERYQSAAALAEDIRRSLNDQPILAQPPSTAYQVRKLVARHKVGFGFATAVVVLLVGFAVAMAVAAQRIASQRDRANREAQVAEQESGFLTNLFQSSRPDQARGKTVTARELLDRGAASIQGDRSMDPEVKAALLDTMGASYTGLGFYAQSQPLLEASLAARRALYGAQSKPVAETLRDLGRLALDRGDTTSAMRDYTRALAVAQQSEGPSNADVAKLLNDIGSAYERSGKLADAQPYLERSLAMTAKIEGPNSKSLIAMRSNLAILAYSRQDYAAAEQQFSQELDLAKRVYGPDHPFVAKITNNLGGVLFTEKKYAAAEAAYAQALTLNRKLLGDKHPEVAVELENIGEARDAQGDLAGADQAYSQALAILRPQVAATDARLRFVETNLGSVLVREGSAAQLQQAELLLRAALAADEKALARGSWDTADAQAELGGALLAQGKLVEAEPLLAGSLPTLQAKLGPNDPAAVTRTVQRLIALYQRNGDAAKARVYAAMLRN